MSTIFFRAGIGCVLYTEQFDIITFQRFDLPGCWQFPQGGIEGGEDYKDTLWRELGEETGIDKSCISEISEFPDWLFYTYTDEIRRKLNTPNTLGQIHRWFFLKIKDISLVETCFQNGHNKEFLSWRLDNFSNLIEASDIKCDVYKSLRAYFENSIIHSDIS